MHHHSSVLLDIENISKSYSVPVLSNICLKINRGEVHAIVGENGAGKSTLCKIIAGIVKPDSGKMILDGSPYLPQNKRDAEKHGVRFVMQELNIIPTLTVAENIFLNELPHQYGWINQKILIENAKQLLARLGMDLIKPEVKVAQLGIGQQQMVEIAAGISKNCSLLILDEPTAALTDAEIEHLFSQINRLKENGTSVIYISHKLEEVMQISDRITVLRDGKLVVTDKKTCFKIDDVIKLMVGRDLDAAQYQTKYTGGLTILQVRNLKCGTRVKNVSFDLKEGEVLGFAGLMGSGRTETMRAIFGADKVTGGDIFLKGNKIQINDPSDAVKYGIAMLPENRKEQGLFLPLSIKHNITINNLKRLSNRFGFIKTVDENLIVEQWRHSLSIKCNSCEQRVSELSGGNQQKVLIARWLFKNCNVVIMDEPTRGIDVGAKFEIYNLIRQLANDKKGIIFVSSDLKELMGVCDRIVVMSNGEVAGLFKRGQWTQDEILRAALSRYIISNDKNGYSRNKN